MANVILTQHTGGGYKYEDEGKVDMFVRNVNRFAAGQNPEHVVDLHAGY
jgi:glyoxylate/hydroxypyruvate reductase A